MSELNKKILEDCQNLMATLQVNNNTKFVVTRLNCITEQTLWIEGYTTREQAEKTARELNQNAPFDITFRILDLSQ